MACVPKCLKRDASLAVGKLERHRFVWNQKGFSLLEMVVAVSVFAVMMAVVVPHIIGVGTKAQTVACEQDQRMIRAALSEYYLENHAYPVGTTEQQLQTLVDDQLLESIPHEPSGGSFTIDDSNGTTVTVSCTVHGTLGDDN